ncbi:MAG: FKBP-type peptidyl-prolyl cis-trans isomerase [Gammaproteobacteria bacterium]|uniref:FKBP-type peptidyl-prolyl cis-trans isomerase n=1 Tax=Pseudomaricurvus alcaniphilus TaxID=1166482 RepID=UPI00140E0C8A|nr:FKBP-type peptidyl-prolyl cis-trans isomerase [Pseudomaricurvus alcaniphilus]MBR9910373.1 FKBP-type peptidyl-prolyl cis-trans isomerase [Gammaproteobacteria bacterium]NHN36216.1 FKBP-type peptidyl-prolyl cis-trans isomerase [Pseudomaricurvus alcaniphilus]
MADAFTTLEQQASYGIGRQMGDQLANAPFEGFTKEAALAGFTDALGGKDFQVQPAEINAAFQEIQARMQAAEAGKAEAMSAEGQAFLAENAKRDEVTVTESGLQFEVLVEGTGAKPSASSTVRTHYHGTLIDGTVFDSSVERGQPAEFPVNGVIAGWTEALQMMPVGSKWKLAIPHDLAYGERGAGGAIAPYTTLVFEVELLDIL